MNNYWNEDAPAQQGGHFRFRYALNWQYLLPLFVLVGEGE
jgi:hypothetical protein